MSRLCLPLVVLVASCPSLIAQTPSTGPDVIVGELHDLANYGSNGGISAFSVGTTSCNIGDTPLSWVSFTSQHPVIGLNMYRLQGDRFTQVGMSWLKHGFLALAGNVCSTCTGPGGSQLDPGCSDPYNASLNGSQSGLGPRSEVNPVTGVFTYPIGLNPPFAPTIGRRIQVANTDLDPAQNPGARYFVEGHYITPDDAAAGNAMNNASYREVDVSQVNPFTYNIAFTAGGMTERTKPGILAWRDADPAVSIQNIDVPGDGRFIVGFKWRDNGNGTYHYEYAVQNFNSDRAAMSFTVGVPAGTQITNAYFHDVDHHSGEVYSGTDWTINMTASSITYSTQPFSSDPNANALRWGQLFTFAFDANAFVGNATIGLFKPGTPSSVTVPSALPPFLVALATPAPAALTPDVATDIDVVVTPITSTPSPAGANLFVSTGGSAFVSTPLTPLGGNVYRATLPASPCFTTVDWYVSLTPVSGGAAITLPANAPAETFSARAGVLAFQDDFETDQGWTVTSTPTLTAGAFERGTPIGGGLRGDPATDGDGSGQCYLTGNAPGDSDVDGGSTTVTSPMLDLSRFVDARLEVLLWHDTVFGQNPNEPGDTLRVEATADGSTWVLLENYGASAGSWVARSYQLANFLPVLTQNVQVRFTSTDAGNPSVVESAIDGVVLVGCEAGPLSGNVGLGAGGPYDVLLVDGFAGGPSRTVNPQVGNTVTISLTQPPSTPFPAGFALFGILGQPTPAAAGPLPFGIGTMAFPPCPVNPADPALFTVADSLGASNCPPFAGSTPAPWSVSIPGGFPFPIAFALQGIMQDPLGSFGLSVTNYVLVSVIP